MYYYRFKHNFNTIIRIKSTKEENETVFYMIL